MRDSQHGYITLQAASKLKQFFIHDKRKPKNTPYDNLPLSAHQDGFWARIEGRTTDKPVTLTGDNATKQMGCYRWNRIIHQKNSANYQMWKKNKPGNFQMWEKIITDATTFEGDYVEREEVQENFCVESLYASENVMMGDIVYLRPSQFHKYFIFDYNPPMRLAVIQENVTQATISLTTLTFGKGKVSPLNVNDTNTSASFLETYSNDPEDTEKWKLDVLNPFRDTVSATKTNPVICQITYSGGHWYLSAVECS